MVRIAINGFGRIGRCILRALQERPTSGIEIVAINEPADASSIFHLTRFDSTHGRFPGQVDLADEKLIIDGKPIQLLHEPDPAKLPWEKLEVDLVLECSGAFQERVHLEKHLSSGAKHVLLSYPVRTEDTDATVVFGTNEQLLSSELKIVSNASCTTNCIVPVIDVLHRSLGVESGAIRTLHSAMNDQHVMDSYHPTDLRKARAAFASFVPVETELARGIERILPELAGKFSAQAIRIPVTDVSAMDLTLVVNEDVTAERINQLLSAAADSELAGVLSINDEPLASCDFIHDSHSGIVDTSQTSVAGKRLVKLFVWFDNEWGYANRMLDTASSWAEKFGSTPAQNQQTTNDEEIKV